MESKDRVTSHITFVCHTYETWH